MNEVKPYKHKNRIRLITATSLFDGHDAAINIMRRMLQASGAEVIHLGHNRSVEEIAQCAVQEGVQGVAVSSYQGGHLEFYKYLFDRLKELGEPQIKIFGGGGGVILPHEVEELHAYGIAGVYTPDDGSRMGLQGMINDLLKKTDFPIDLKEQKEKELNQNSISRIISTLENQSNGNGVLKEIQAKKSKDNIPVIGITGTGGSGKSSLVDEITRRFLEKDQNTTIGIISVDPSKRKTGGALLGDRIRMNSVYSPRVYMRSMATRESNQSISGKIGEAISVLKASEFDIILLETSGIGQSDSSIIDYCDISLYVMTPEFGAASQLEKIDMLDFADMVALNKFDKGGALDALHQVRKQYQRNFGYWTKELEQMPVFATVASQLNDSGTDELFEALIQKIKNKNTDLISVKHKVDSSGRKFQLPTGRIKYLSEIVETIRREKKLIEEQSEIAGKLCAVHTSLKFLDGDSFAILTRKYDSLKHELKPEYHQILKDWEQKKENYSGDSFVYTVRGKEIKVSNSVETLSHIKIPKVILPKFKSWEDILRWSLTENVPGEYPYTAGVFPFKRENESPTRMFAGEGGPERTNKRFHYLSKGQEAKRLSTAFDSVTLYGEDPSSRPDIYGKVGNSGVSIATLDDAKKLYYGFDLCDPMTSVSLTINGPAPTITAFLLNAAIDQQCEKYIIENKLEKRIKDKIKKFYKERGLKEPEYFGELPENKNGLGLMLLGVPGNFVLPEEIYNEIKKNTISQIRGTVQADILKEDQAQNTCIFSIDFSLKLMGDIEQYFIQNNVRNFYSVSISGYHIAEAGANPITQLAFTLANGFTYVEYFLSRGMKIDEFAPHLSFFFSNGIDPEFAVIGRVARRIWARALKLLYGANERSQKLKYHIQTSGRSLHAQEIEFNDIRTTLQALYAIYDNCNSLHTNAYDEAITTPTEESVRRAMAIQLIINHEYGLAKNQNPNQGSFIIEELTDLVEEAVLSEFERISERGGVLGSMETNYQRDTIQKESLYYESLKNNGKLPIMGVNTFLSSTGSPTIVPKEVIRSTKEEKEHQLQSCNNFKEVFTNEGLLQLKRLKDAAQANENVFEVLMEASKYCSLGQITNALYEVGGKYRRNM